MKMRDDRKFDLNSAVSGDYDKDSYLPKKFDSLLSRMVDSIF